MFNTFCYLACGGGGGGLFLGGPLRKEGIRKSRNPPCCCCCCSFLLSSNSNLISGKYENNLIWRKFGKEESILKLDKCQALFKIHLLVTQDLWRQISTRIIVTVNLASGSARLSSPS